MVTIAAYSNPVPWFSGPLPDLIEAGAKAAMMYATAWALLRMGERRTLAQFTLIDVVAAVAVGAIVGRSAIAKEQSYAEGAIALVALLLTHHAASRLRLKPLVARFADHPIRVLVADGQLRAAELRRSGMTENDLYGQLRLQGVFDLRDVRYVLYEARGGLTVVPAAPGPVPALVKTVLHDAGEPVDQVGVPARR